MSIWLECYLCRQGEALELLSLLLCGNTADTGLGCEPFLPGHYLAAFQVFNQELLSA